MLYYVFALSTIKWRINSIKYFKFIVHPFLQVQCKTLVAFAPIKFSKCEKMFKFNFVTTEEENQKEDSIRDEPKLSIESKDYPSKS